MERANAGWMRAQRRPGLSYFPLVASEPHRGFGHSLIGVTWEMKL